MQEKKEKLVLCLNDLEEQTLLWLWPGRLPAGKLTLIDGDPSQGKSLMTLDLASRLTTAVALPDGFTPPQPSAVVLVGSEDGMRDTVLPRLRAAGADLCRVHAFAGRARGGVWSRWARFPGKEKAVGGREPFLSLSRFRQRGPATRSERGL